MTQEALKLALAALESAVRYHGIMLMSDPPQDAWKYHRVENKADKAITAIKKALAQPDTDMSYTIALQRAIEWHCDGKTVPLSVAQSCPYHAEKLNQALAQEQEPVACIYKGYLYMAHEFQSGQVPVDSQPLYTTPPQRTWVGLTDEEFDDLRDNNFGVSPLISAVEAKLKERNT